MAKDIAFYVFNIKLQTNKTPDERRKEYVRLISELSNGRFFLQVGKMEAITMYSALGASRDPNPKYIYGHAAKGTYIAGNEVTILKDGKITKGLNDPNQLIEPTTIDFIFVPEIHRFGLQKNPKGPSAKQFEVFLNSYLRKFTANEDLLEIILEKDDSVIKEIYTAKSVYSISYKISYTNDDLTKDFGEELDEQLKKAKIGEMSLVAKSDNITEGLNIDGSLLLKGGLELAEKNGEIRNAVIVRPGNRKKVKISNTEKPKIQSFEHDEKGSKWLTWANRLLGIYK